ncbi:MAG: peptidylprolyl isomerase [Sphingobacteriales bacterium]|nr:MAG: peptidylprolyl isomerase [Sphingobacteriales bacterium]
MHKILLLNTLLLLSTVIYAQDEVLFTIDDTEVKRSEFENIYKKNNYNGKEDFSRTSIENYLDLYINFRLKVKEANSLGYAQNDKFRDEFAVYEQQLLNSYVDKEVLDKIIEQEYNRSKKDVELSHIFFAVTNDSTKLTAEKKAKDIYQKIKSNQLSFDEAAKISDDANTKFVKGNLGWYNAYQIALPEIEDIAYQLEPGQIAEPILTKYGWHIIKLNNTRTARPTLKVAIIKKFLPLNGTKDDHQALQDTMKMIAKMYQDGVPFEQLVTKYSEDENTKTFGGKLDWFGINTFAPEFEEAAYSIKNIGDISEPVLTKSAWYIIKKVDETKPQTFEESKSVLKTKLQNSALYEMALTDFVNDKKATYGYVANNKNIALFKKYMARFIGDYSFKYKDTFPNLVLYKIGNVDYDQNKIGSGIEKIYYTLNTKQGTNRLDALFDEVLKNNIVSRYKEDIQQNNIEYKNLIQEYRDGIMIFDISEQKIWNKALEDSIGVRNHYEQNKEKYIKPSTIKERTVQLNNSKNAKKIYKTLLEDPNINSNVLQDKLSVMKETSPVITKEISNSKNAVSVQKPKKTDNTYTIKQYYQYSPEKTKDFEECRGYVIADYQEKLEKEWIDNLKVKYPVKINQDILNKLIKK